MQNLFSCIYKDDDSMMCIADNRKCFGACYPECEICEHFSEEGFDCKKCLHVEHKFDPVYENNKKKK